MNTPPLLHIKNEFSKLLSVVVGTADSLGPEPTAEECYDPKSRENVLRGTYPKEADLREEINQFAAHLESLGIEVIRPEVLKGINQIFTRDIGFVVDDLFIITNMLSERSDEIKALDKLISTFPEDKVVTMPEDSYLEGGDIIICKHHLLIGVATLGEFGNYQVARTNYKGIDFIKEQFPTHSVLAFELNKSDTDPKKNALHLDCCFQPLGMGHCLIHEAGFKHSKDLDIIRDIYGAENLITIDENEMYDMGANVFSVAPDHVISERGFTRVNNELRKRGYRVDEVKYSETAKMEGLLRCSTLPLQRK